MTHLAKTGATVKSASSEPTKALTRVRLPEDPEPLTQRHGGTQVLGKSLQENVLTLLVHSDEHGPEIIALLDASFFEGNYRLVADRAMFFWKTEGRAPGIHLPDLMDKFLHDQKGYRKDVISKIIRDMYELAPKIDTDYVMNGLYEFYGKQRDKKIIIKAAELAGREETTHEEIIELLREHIRTAGAVAKGFTWEAPDFSLLDDRRGSLPEFPLDTIASEWLRGWLIRTADGTATSVAHVVVPFLGIDLIAHRQRPPRQRQRLHCAAVAVGGHHRPLRQRQDARHRRRAQSSDHAAIRARAGGRRVASRARPQGRDCQGGMRRLESQDQGRRWQGAAEAS